MAIKETTELPLFVVYCNPSDFPGLFVVRRQVATADGCYADQTPLVVTGDLDAARRALPPGLYNLGRMEGDDPAIYEVWV